MKLTPIFISFALLFAAGLRAAENTPAATGKKGYTVTFEAKVNEKGEKESLRIVSSEDTTTGNIIDKLAMAMAIKAELPVREKDGKPAAYTARMPFFFPIEGDEGPEANNAPKPSVTGSSGIPLYPRELLAQGVVGGVIYELRIDASGKLTSLKTLRASHPEFDAAARAVLEKWEFRPAEKDGEPVESRWNLAVVFEQEEAMADLKWRVAPRPNLGSLIVLPDRGDAETPSDTATKQESSPQITVPAPLAPDSKK